MRVLLTGDHAMPWAEATAARPISTDECPVCRSRDFGAERERGYQRTCLRCYRASDDPRGWHIGYSRLADDAKLATAAAEADREREAAVARTNQILLSRIKRGAPRLLAGSPGFARVSVKGLKGTADLTHETIRTLLKLGVDVTLSVGTPADDPEPLAASA